jgi:hypothetical protein
MNHENMEPPKPRQKASCQGLGSRYRRGGKILR